MEYETFEHGADIGIRGKGKSIEEAFEGIAKAMFSIMIDLDKIDCEKKIKIELDSNDLTSLMVFWLNKLLTQADLNRIIFKEFEISIEKTDDSFFLKSFNWGGRIKDLEDIGVEVKGVTYSSAKVFKTNSLWIAQCVVDV